MEPFLDILGASLGAILGARLEHLLECLLLFLGLAVLAVLVAFASLVALFSSSGLLLSLFLQCVLALAVLDVLLSLPVLALAALARCCLLRVLFCWAWCSCSVSPGFSFSSGSAL